MVGFLNAHGTSPCLFGGEFLDMSLVHDDERPRGKASVLDLADNDDFFAKHEEPFDPNFEETLWSSLLLGADYDWDRERLRIIRKSADFVAERYADVIRLNDEIGYRGRSAEIIVLNPTFVGQARTNVRDRHWSDKRSLREQSSTYDKRRGKAHAK